MYQRAMRGGTLLLCALALALQVIPAPAAERHDAKRSGARKTAGASHRRASRKPVPTAVKKRAAKRQLVQLRQEIGRKRAVLRETKQRQRKVSEEIRENQEGLRAAWSRLRETKTHLTLAERDVSYSERQLQKAQAALAAHVRLLRGRLVDVYKHGTVSYATVLLQSRDTWDLTSRGYMLQRVVHSDVTLLNKIKAEQAAVAEHTERLRQRRNRVAQLRLETEEHVSEVNSRIVQQRQLHSALQRDRQRLEAALAELEENSREVERMVRAFEARPDVARHIPKPWSGSFSQPISGRITSTFGMRFHPVLRVRKLHTGVDIGAPAGTPIHAAGDGVVVHSGWWGGYGNCVVIAHGNGRSTLYAHCSSLAVGAGARIRRGQVIGRVGSTGFSTGPHLHFEVRRNGAPVNPMGH